MFPLSVVVRLPFTTVGTFQCVTADAVNYGSMAATFLANGLSGNLTPASIPRGTYTLPDLVKTGAGTSINVKNQRTGTAVVNMSISLADQASTPVAYKHLGNIYKKYRVLGWKFGLSLRSAGTIGGATPFTNNVFAVSLFATIDPDLGISPVLPYWLKYKTLPFSKTKLLSYTQYDKHQSSYISIKHRAKSIVRDPIYMTSENWVGNCVKAPIPTTAVPSPDPVYQDPANPIYFGFSIDDSTNTYGFNQASSGFPFCSYVLSWTPIVKFYEPHENNDFQVSLV